jgi:hypothetical protein
MFCLMKADAVAKENRTPRDDEVRSIVERTQSGYMETAFSENSGTSRCPATRAEVDSMLQVR